MTFLDINYQEAHGPADFMFSALDYTPTSPRGSEGYTTVTLDEGQPASSRALEAATLLRQQILDAGGPGLELREEYPPRVAEEDLLLDQFLSESPIPGRIMARWKYHNHLQRTKFAARFPDPAAQPAPGTYDFDEDGWSPSDYASFAMTIGQVTILLYAQSFADVAMLVQAHAHPVATPTAKQAYLAAMQAELPTAFPNT